MKNNKLYTYWITTLYNLNTPSTPKSDTLFNEIIFQYTRQGRHYHNLDHIQSILHYIDKQSLSPTNNAILVLSAFMHDIIYDTNSKENELNSAIYSSSNLRDIGVKEVYFKQVDRIILATERHVSKDHLCQLFLDMDLSILGSDKASYLLYVENIRKEYISIPAPIYYNGRKLFIERMLAKPFIYQTSYFRKKLEVLAKQNLQDEWEWIKINR